MHRILEAVLVLVLCVTVVAAEDEGPDKQPAPPEKQYEARRTGVAIPSNSIFANSQLGIELFNNGNNSQATPTLTAVESGDDTTTIQRFSARQLPSPLCKQPFQPRASWFDWHATSTGHSYWPAVKSSHISRVL